MTGDDLSSDRKYIPRLSTVGVADCAIASYVVLSVAYDDGSLLAKLARVLLVAAAIFESTIKPVRMNHVVLWQLLFVGYSTLSIVWAYSAERANDMSNTLLLNGICVVSLVFLIIDDVFRVKVFLVSFLVAPVVLMARISIEHGLLIYLNARDAGDTNANIVGMTAAFGFGIAYLAFAQKVLLPRSTAGLFLFLNVSVAILSASRKAIIMIGLIVLFYSLLSKRSGTLGRLARFGAAAAGAAGGYWLILNYRPLYDLIGHRMETMVNGFRDSGEVDASTSTRLSLIDRGVRWFQENPWHGYGVDNFRALMAHYFPRESAYYAHNNFVEVLVNGGVVGATLFYWLYVVIVVVGFKRRKSLTSIQTMVLGLVLTLLFIEYGAIDYYSRIFMAFVGVAWVVICTDTSRIPPMANGFQRISAEPRLHPDGCKSLVSGTVSSLKPHQPRISLLGFGARPS